MESMQTSWLGIIHLDGYPAIGSSSSSNNNNSNKNESGQKVKEKEKEVSSQNKRVQKHHYPRPAGIYQRKRATQACLPCRFRRTKCDNSRPSCASCVRSGAECTYQQTDTSTFDPASLAILKRLDDLERLLQANPVKSAASESIYPSTPLSDRPPSIAGVHSHRQRSCINIDALLSWPVFADHDFPPHIHPTSPVEAEKPHSELSTLLMPADVDLPAAESLLRIYFDHVHIFNPILEEEEVRGYMKTVCINGVGWDAKSCLLLLIYAHGSISTAFVMESAGIPPTTFHQSNAFYQAQSYFVAAQKRMGMLLSRNGTIEAQCFFLAGAFLMSTFRPIEAWKMFVQALACCHCFSIPQNPAISCSVDEWSPKERIFWSCFKSELELRQELNLPQQGVPNLTYPDFFPSPPERLKTEDEAAWYFYLAEIALRRLRNRVLSYLIQSESTLEVNMQLAILDFEQQIDAWLRSLPEALALDVSHSPKDQPEALRFVLNGHVLDCLETMYWPFVVDAIYGRSSSDTGKLYLRKGLKVCVDRIQHDQRGFFHRHHGTWLMLRSCTRSALVLLAAVRREDLAAFLPIDWQEAVINVRNMLRFWKDESNDVYKMLSALEMLVDECMICG